MFQKGRWKAAQNGGSMGQRWGQHFLHDPGVVKKILDAAGLGPGDRVLEIGPGEGVLTLPMTERADRVLACEIDPELARRLPERPNLTVVQQDFLKVDLESLLEDPPGWKVVANLPYYITAPILEKLLLEGSSRIKAMWLMMQWEVAERILSPASRKAGSLTYFVSYFATPRLALKVKPGAFRPPPEVDSAVLELVLKPERDVEARPGLFRLLRAAFNQRRKTLRRSLRSVLEEPEVSLEKAGIDPGRRPETLSLEEFLRLERAARPNSEEGRCRT